MTPLAALTTPDTIVLAVCAVLAVRGAFKGFAWQAVRTLGLVVALLAAGLWHRAFGTWLTDTFSFVPATPAPWVAWFLILAGTLVLATFFAYVTKGAAHRIHLGGLDRILGFALGGAMGLFLMTACFLAWGSFVEPDTLESTLEGSLAARVMPRVVDAVEPFMPADMVDRWGKVLHTLHGLEGEASPGGG